MKKKTFLLRVGEQISFRSNSIAQIVNGVITAIWWNSPKGGVMFYIEEPENPPPGLMVEIDYPEFGLRQKGEVFDLKETLRRQAVNN